MKRVVVFADEKWSIGRVHHSIAAVLKNSYQFSFHYDACFYLELFMQDLKECDVCVTTPNLIGDIVHLVKSPELLKKFLFVFHYAYTGPSIASTVLFPQSHFGTISPAVIPKAFPKKVYVMPSGVDPTLFPHRERSGSLNNLGWCGNLWWTSKRVDWSYRIAGIVQNYKMIVFPTFVQKRRNLQ